jgi:hypothetical protein
MAHGNATQTQMPAWPIVADHPEDAGGIAIMRANAEAIAGRRL